MKLSFYDWCINNNRQDLLKRWDYNENNCNPKDVSCSSRKSFYFLCEHNTQHKSELHRISHITYDHINVNCKQCNSFYQWCIDNGRFELTNTWDYQLNTEDIHYISHCSSKKCYFKIVDGMPDIYYPLCEITGHKKLSPIDKFYNSFGYWLISTYGERAIQKYWSDKNTKTPWEYDSSSGKKVWFKCQEKDYHEDYLSSIDKFKYGSRCPWCAGKKVHPLDSFAQYNIDKLGSDFLEKYWCSDNIVDPWSIRPFANDIVVKIQCQNKQYHQYEITVANFSMGTRCSFCSNSKIHYLDSLGSLFPEIIDLWSDKNEKSPYEYHPHSHKFIWLKCENGIHNDYQRRISDYTSQHFTCCSNCVKENQESKLQKAVRMFLETLPYRLLHEFDCDIVPINPDTKMKMPFDNEICNINHKNLIIEVHGEQHYKLNGWHIARSKHTHRTPEEEFEYQKWKDLFKKEYAISNKYEYLEIPYYSIIDDSYKDLIINKINEIQHI